MCVHVLCVCACVRACVRVCVRVCMYACVRVCMRARVCVRACAYVYCYVHTLCLWFYAHKAESNGRHQCYMQLLLLKDSGFLLLSRWFVGSFIFLDVLFSGWLPCWWHSNVLLFGIVNLIGSAFVLVWIPSSLVYSLHHMFSGLCNHLLWKRSVRLILLMCFSTTNTVMVVWNSMFLNIARNIIAVRLATFRMNTM